MKIESKKLKSYLRKIADNVDKNTELEDVYNQLALLADIDISEDQVKNKETFTQEEVEKRASKWLK